MPAGNYALKAVATDSNGNTATSRRQHHVVTNFPAAERAVCRQLLVSDQRPGLPCSGQHRRSRPRDRLQRRPDGQYFSDGTSIGIVTNTGGVLLTNSTPANPFFLDWSNVPAGSYALTAVATDSAGQHRRLGAGEYLCRDNLPPPVSIYAPDPVAVEGTNTIAIGSGLQLPANYSHRLQHRDLPGAPGQRDQCRSDSLFFHRRHGHQRGGLRRHFRFCHHPGRQKLRADRHRSSQ